jgi:hypothetical protein
MKKILLTAIVAVLSFGILTVEGTSSQSQLKIATFQFDATPPLGTPLCAGACLPAKKIVDRLSARGIILLTDGLPIVLCSVDWVGIGNTGHDAWRDALAKAAHTTAARVAIHTVHQHDTPVCDFAAEKLLASHGLGGTMTNDAFVRKTIARAAGAVRESLKNVQCVTHLGLGTAKVDRVASNRRILGPDGKVKYVRFSSCRNKPAIDAPEGVIDPNLKLISFWNGDKPLVSVTYYATHPQSFYCRGAVSADFVGLARSLREATLPDIVHIHFNGAGGNLAAGKYNDGSPPRRLELAKRLAQGMSDAWEATEKQPITARDIKWKVKPVKLPVRDTLLNENALLKIIDDPNSKLKLRIRAARDLTWKRCCESGHKIDLACLQMRNAYILHMPGELFVEYQLAAQDMRPDDFVCMAAYGDYGPGYICTEIAYSQGGYEAGPPDRVGPQAEKILMEAMAELLSDK